MTEPTPADMRRVELARDDLEYFRPNGGPVSLRHITSNRALSRYFKRVLGTMQTLAEMSGLPEINPDVLTAKISCDAYVLPPDFIKLRLRLGYLVLEHTPYDERPPLRFVLNAGQQFEGAAVGVHRIGLGLHQRYVDHVFFSTLQPNARDTSSVVIGVPPSMLGRGMAVKDISTAPIHELIDPSMLLQNGFQAEAPIYAEPPTVHDAYM